MKTLKDLFLEELSDRYDSEKQLVKAMPKMIEASTCNSLKKIITSHLKQTEGHVVKVDKVFKAFNETPQTKTCQATLGLLKEGDEIAQHFKGSLAINAALISTAQKVEHYEIASYGCLKEWAQVLGNHPAAEMLQSILDEENDANKSLIELAVTKSNKDALCADGAKGSSCSSDKKDGHRAMPGAAV